MNTNDVDRDMRLQVEAERAEREGLPAGRDPRVDRYRLVMRALRQPLEPRLPADFDSRVAELALQRDGDGFEDLLVSLLLLAMGIGALLFVGPSLAKMAQSIVNISLPQLPWHSAVMAGICIGVVWAVDRLLTLQGWKRTHPGACVF